MKAMFGFGKRKKRNKVIVLLDYENLYIHYSPKAIIGELNKILKQIAQEVGEISKVFVFLPPNTASLFAEDFYEAGFITVLCPKVKGKDNAEKDTVDETLMDLGQELIAEMPDMTHLFLGSGDIDFLKLIIKATRAGLDVGLIVSSLGSLSLSLIKRIDNKPGSSEKMLYVFPQAEKQN